MHRTHQGKTNHLAGLAAEAQVADRFVRGGQRLRDARWRGPGGEIDLIFGDEDGLVFVEVKKARDHAAALARVTPRQIGRIARSAEAYVAAMPRGSLTEFRIDLALVDAAGRIEMVENVTLH